MKALRCNPFHFRPHRLRCRIECKPPSNHIRKSTVVADVRTYRKTLRINASKIIFMASFTFTAYKIESFGFGKAVPLFTPKFYSRFIFNLAKVLFDYVASAAAD